MKSLLKLTLVLSAILGISTQGRAQAPVEIPPISIKGYELIGTGCPQGSFKVLPGASNSERQAILITFEKYTANVTTSVATAFKDCRISLQLEAPRGIRYSLINARYDGNAILDTGVRGILTARYSWRGAALTLGSSTPKELTGPYDDVFTFTDSITARQWSACDSQEVLQIQTMLTVSNTSPRASGSMRLDSTEIDLKSDVRQPANIQEGVLLEFAIEPCSRPLPGR